MGQLGQLFYSVSNIFLGDRTTLRRIVQASRRGEFMGMSLRIAVAAFAILITGQGLVAQQPSIEELTAKATGEDSIEAAKAVAALGERRPVEKRVVDVLIAALADNRHAEDIPPFILFDLPTVATRASRALTRIGEPAVEPICQLLQTEMRTSQRLDARREESVRTMRNAIDALAGMRGDAIASQSTLCDVLKSESQQLRYWTVVAIRAIETDPASIQRLLQGMLDDPSPEIRSEVVQAMSECGKNAEPSIAKLITLLDDPADRAEWFAPDAAGQRALRADVAVALGEIGTPAIAALPRLKAMMVDDDDPVVRVTAAFAVAKLDVQSIEAIQYLVQSLENREYGTGCVNEAAERLGRLGSVARFTVPTLIRLAKESDEDETGIDRNAIIRAIQLIGPDDIEQILLGFQNDEDSIVRETVIDCLVNARASSEKVISAFILALYDTEEAYITNIRLKAAEGLGKLGSRATRAVPDLERVAKKDENEDVRAAAVNAIKLIRDDK